MAKRAIFQGPVEIGETPVYAEGTSAVALVPGYVVTRSGGTLALLNAAATNATEALVVVERGSGFKGDITTPWTIGDTVRAVRPRSGQFVNVACKTAQTLAKGDFLTSKASAGGLLEKGVAGTDVPLFFVEEAVTTSAAGQLVLAYKA